jgi:hypothetical protein
MGRGLKMLCAGSEGDDDRGQKECACPPELPCKYRYLFESPGAQEDSAPRPYVISSPLTAQQSFEPGEALDFGLVLIGHAIGNLPDILETFTEVGRCAGIGQIGHKPDRGRFAVEAVWQHRFRQVPVLVYTDDDETMLKNEEPENLADIPFPQGITPDATNITLTFLTPTGIRVAIKGNAGQREIEKPIFEPLFRRLIDRFRLLVNTHCDENIPQAFGDHVRAASEVELVASDTRLITFPRYSFDQEQHIPVAGFVGSATYAGNLEPFISLLMLGQVLHVGRNTVLGLGEYRIDDPLQQVTVEQLQQVYGSQSELRRRTCKENGQS